ncbi:flagellar basal body-associated FliL family protein [Rhizobium sp. L1K21]|uniref:flagellar basal body-associated FliL family protein n=1 Tax=Rhizobium sp. L1K21 TaxID=2954933 RepID=UPI0020921390|nr:flagellar basal body-associated FliL family protein [Rhizobium sp. L1K21]MCO6187120.1 flagellar basal body-associated FliL family protein [Rhizobium sp. L1K21]
MADTEDEDEGKKKGGMIPTIGIAVGLTIVAAGGGWVLGGMLSGSFLTEEKKQEIAKAAELAAAGAEGHGTAEAKPGEDIVPHISTEENGVYMLEPITSNLSYPSENWIRVEVALLFKGSPDVGMAEDIHQDIVAYLRTVSLQQIQGPRGFDYLKQDLEERVELRSEGKVSKIMFRTFVIE